MSEKNVISEFLRDVQEGNENVIELAQEVLGDGSKKVNVSLGRRALQKEQPMNPPKAQSPKRAHVFHNLAGFIAYLGKYKSSDTVVFSDVSSSTISAVIDEKAGEGFEIIRLVPQSHPLFAPWESLLRSEPMPIQEFATFVTANRRAVVDTDVKQLIMTLSQIRASKKITIQQGAGKRGINGVSCEFEIQGQPKSDPVELPESITIAVPLYVAGPVVDFEFDLTIEFGEENEVVVSVTSSDVKVKQIEAFDEMLKQLALEGVVITMGQPRHEEWRRLS